MQVPVQAAGPLIIVTVRCEGNEHHKTTMILSVRDLNVT